MRIWAGLALLLSLSACAGLQARSSFSKGNKARSGGDLGSALSHYRTAADLEPANAQYQQAFASVQHQLVSAQVNAAFAAESSGQLSLAERHWAEAARLDPSKPQYQARRELVGIKIRRGSNEDKLKLLQKMIVWEPQDSSLYRQFNDAKAIVCNYYLLEGRDAVERKDWIAAEKAYAKLREYDPQHPELDSSRVKSLDARVLEQKGDRKLAKGDSLGAYKIYQEAYSLKKSRRLSRKMKRAKRGAGSILSKLSKVSRYEKAGKWEAAAELLTAIASRKDVPEGTRERVSRARKKSAQLRADKAMGLARRGKLKKAIKQQALTLEHTDGPVDAVRNLKQAQKYLAQKDPGGAEDLLNAVADFAGEIPAVASAQEIQRALVKGFFSRVERMGKDDPAEALVQLVRLEKYSEQFPAYKKLQKQLTRKSFGLLLSKADAASKKAKYQKAARFLKTALEVSKAPSALEEELQGGLAAFQKREYPQALERFNAGLKRYPRSKLARSMVRLGENARLENYRREAARARAVGDLGLAASLYRKILEIVPTDAKSLVALDSLKDDLVKGTLETAEAHEEAGRKNLAVLFYARVLNQVPSHREAQERVAALRGALGDSSGQRAWVLPVRLGEGLAKDCKQAEDTLRRRLALYLSKSKLKVSFLDAKAQQEAEAKAELQPRVGLQVRLDSCELSAKLGKLTVSYGESGTLLNGQVSAKFNPKSIPKDELESGGSGRVLTELVGKVSSKLSQKLSQLSTAQWLALAGLAQVEAKDQGGAVELYAQLYLLPEAEKKNFSGVLEQMDSYLQTVYR